MKSASAAACALLYPCFIVTFTARASSCTAEPGQKGLSLVQRPAGTSVSRGGASNASYNSSSGGAKPEVTVTDARPANLKKEIETKKPVSYDTAFHTMLLLSLIMLLVTGSVFMNHGLFAAFIVFMYIGSLIAVQFAVKQALSNGYMYVNTLTCFHMFFTALVAFIIERPSTSYALPVLPVSMANGMTLVLGNSALQHGGVAFVSMVSSCTPAIAYVFEQLAGRRQDWTDGLTGTVLVCVGSMLCVQGETTASLICFLMAGGATVFRSLKSIIQQELLLGELSPMSLVFWSAFWSFLMLLPLVFVSEGTEGLQALKSVSSRMLLPIGLSIVCATSVNTTQVYAVKKLGSLLQVMVGNLNSVLVVAIAAALFSEEVLPMQWLGMEVRGADESRPAIRAAEPGQAAVEWRACYFAVLRPGSEGLKLS
eukprot:TRINITY_DN29668_c0_g1_i1.p1 TRINITY_DN29668_c0_g1~~TRINITY_DN29668_c0_g1_i1.p1  ORF type:complete len:425 (+),score=75.89 TRINITY_DN29668_c0_g1_i1:53-1327(+)